MFKFLIIVFVFFFFLSKIGGFLFKTFFGATQRAQQQQHAARKPADGNVSIDYVPKEGGKVPKNFKGGDYVDFEEIKE